jgi:peptidoglycan/xylan/chitin deacetylase (PgdA/CDA1 family)
MSGCAAVPEIAMSDRILPTHGRYEYSPIIGRPGFRWPGDRKLAVYFALGIEHYAFGQGMTENLVAGMPYPDVLNDSWREYGNRVGGFRLLDLFRQQGVPLTILLNSAICSHAPELLAACQADGCEIVGHGFANSDTMAGMDEATEAAYTQSVAEQIAAATGERPQGWASPWIAETPLTPDLLQENGYGYLLDWCMDDQPVWLRTRSGRMLSVPYTQELNDSAAAIGRQVGPDEFSRMIIDQFDEMRETDDDQALVMSVIVHSFISGQPFRLRALRRAIEHIVQFRDQIWLTQPGAIAAHFRALPWSGE